MTENPWQIQHRYRMCTRKALYDTKTYAKKIRRRMLAHGKGDSNLRVYRCLYCRGWHIGNSSSRRV
jgi:hypothetical protein